MVAEIVETLARALVDQPDKVELKHVEGEKAVILELRVAPEDVGKIIGKQGRIVKAIRTVAKAAAAKEGKKVVVEVIS